MASNKGPHSHVGGEENGKKKAKTRGFNRTANEANSNNNNTDMENIQNKRVECTEQLSLPDALALPSHDCLPPGQPPSLEPGVAAHGTEYPVQFGQYGSAHPPVSPLSFW